MIIGISRVALLTALNRLRGARKQTWTHGLEGRLHVTLVRCNSVFGFLVLPENRDSDNCCAENKHKKLEIWREDVESKTRSTEFRFDVLFHVSDVVLVLGLAEFSNTAAICYFSHVGNDFFCK